MLLDSLILFNMEHLCLGTLWIVTLIYWQHFATEEQPAQETEEPSICYKHFAHLPFWQLQWAAASLTTVQVQNYLLHFSGWLKTGTSHFEYSTSLNIDSYNAVLQSAGIAAQGELTMALFYSFYNRIIHSVPCKLHFSSQSTLGIAYCPHYRNLCAFFLKILIETALEKTLPLEINYFCLLLVS